VYKTVVINYSALWK